MEILTLTSAEQPDGLIDSPEWRHIHSLPPHSSSTSDSSGVLPRATVGDGIHQHLQWVLYACGWVHMIEERKSGSTFSEKPEATGIQVTD